jgi:hypothetical protein
MLHYLMMIAKLRTILRAEELDSYPADSCLLTIRCHSRQIIRYTLHISAGVNSNISGDS